MLNISKDKCFRHSLQQKKPLMQFSCSMTAGIHDYTIKVPFLFEMQIQMSNDLRRLFRCTCPSINALHTLNAEPGVQFRKKLYRGNCKYKACPFIYVSYPLSTTRVHRQSYSFIAYSALSNFFTTSEIGRTCSNRCGSFCAAMSLVMKTPVTP